LKSFGQVIGESDGSYRNYLSRLVSSQVQFIRTLEDTAERLPQTAQYISEVITDNKLVLEEYQVRLKAEYQRALSSKKD